MNTVKKVQHTVYTVKSMIPALNQAVGPTAQAEKVKTEWRDSN